MVVDAEPTDSAFGNTIGLRWQRLEVRLVELFEERPTGDPEPSDRAFVIELVFRSNQMIDSPRLRPRLAAVSSGSARESCV
jgi:hypothetical protein